MHGVKKWMNIGGLLLGAGIFAYGDRTAEAGAMANPVIYQTSGVVYSDSTEITPGGQTNSDPYIGFQGVVNGTSDLPGPFTLGQFVLTLPPTGASKDYLNTPFIVQVDFGGSSSIGPTESLTLFGQLNGVLTGDASSTLQATVSRIELFSPLDTTPSKGALFPVGDFRVLGPSEFAINPGNGNPVVQAEVVPEPASCATILVSLGWLVLARSRRRKNATSS